MKKIYAVIIILALAGIGAGVYYASMKNNTGGVGVTSNSKQKTTNQSTTSQEKTFDSQILELYKNERLTQVALGGKEVKDGINSIGSATFIKVVLEPLEEKRGTYNIGKAELTLVKSSEDEYGAKYLLKNNGTVIDTVYYLPSQLQVSEFSYNNTQYLLLGTGFEQSGFPGNYKLYKIMGGNISLVPGVDDKHICIGYPNIVLEYEGYLYMFAAIPGRSGFTTIDMCTFDGQKVQQDKQFDGWADWRKEYGEEYAQDYGVGPEVLGNGQISLFEKNNNLYLKIDNEQYPTKFGKDNLYYLFNKGNLLEVTPVLVGS